MRDRCVALVLWVAAIGAVWACQTQVSAATVDPCPTEVETLSRSDPQMDFDLVDAASHGDWKEMRKLMWFGADPRVLERSKWYKRAFRERLSAMLANAAGRGDDRRVVALIRQGADVNAHLDQHFYWPPLIWAARCGRASTVRVLLAHGADVNITSTYQFNQRAFVEKSTALHWAVWFEKNKMVELLLQNGADPNAEEVLVAITLDGTYTPIDRWPWRTPLLGSRGSATTEILLRYGADPNFRNDSFYPRLIFAAARGDRAECELLLRYGANRDFINDDGNTPADVARLYGHPDVAQLIDHWR